jgi:hypothetical protein
MGMRTLLHDLDIVQIKTCTKDGKLWLNKKPPSVNAVVSKLEK